VCAVRHTRELSRTLVYVLYRRLVLGVAMPSVPRVCPCTRCHLKNPVRLRTWKAHAVELAYGTLKRWEAPVEGKHNEDTSEDSDDTGSDGSESTSESEEDDDAAEFAFAAQVVAEVANGGSSQTSAGNMLGIVHQYLKKYLPADVDFPKTWYLCEKLGNSKGTCAS
jgi:hypothetical protein